MLINLTRDRQWNAMDDTTVEHRAIEHHFSNLNLHLTVAVKIDVEETRVSLFSIRKPRHATSTFAIPE